MQEKGIKKLYETLEDYDITSDVLEDIDVVQKMIENNDYNKEKVIELESKYSVETMFLMDLENSQDSNKMGFENNYEDSDLQVLLNLKDRLYLIGVYKVLKMQGKEIPKEIIDSNYDELIELIK